MLIRPVLSSSFGQAARSSIRSKAPVARHYATEAGKPSGGSNLPLVLALGGVAGIGAWYSLGGFNDPKKAANEIQEKGKEVAVDARNTVEGTALNKDKFTEFTLKEIKPYNHDSATFIFELPEGKKSGMSVASAVLFKSVDDVVKDDNGKPTIRPYTPTSAPNAPGSMDFLIKKYPGGKMTEHVHGMKPGDKISIKGPIAKFPYKANEFESIGMIAGGSGITPMWQVIQDIASNPSDKTKVTLIYSNKTEQDILLREEFDKLATKDDRFTVVYGLDKLPKGFNGFEATSHPSLSPSTSPSPSWPARPRSLSAAPLPRSRLSAVVRSQGQPG